ncbi:MAG: hypothetical protein ACI8UO_001793 [Verrucomicrobiales bacterium]|jgi:hypothetical protein
MHRHEEQRHHGEGGPNREFEERLNRLEHATQSLAEHLEKLTNELKRR